MATATLVTDHTTSEYTTVDDPIDKQKVKRSGDNVSKQDVELVVKRVFGPSTRLVDHHLRSYSMEKIGFMGTHQQLIVTVERENGHKEVCTFFLKGIPYELEEQASVIEESRAFYKEAHFYEYMVPELVKSIKDASWVPRCYLIKDNVLLMEDLKSMNFVMRDKPLDTATLKSALTALGKMHAASVLAEKRMGKSFFELYPDVFTEMLFAEKGRLHNLWFKNGIQAAATVAKSLGLDHTCVPKVCQKIFEALVASKKWRNVVCHGDQWSNNLLFDESQPLPRCRLVDFQTIRYVPPTADLAQLFYLTMEKTVREANEEGLLGHYHQVFCATLMANDEEVSRPSFEEIVREYEDMRIFGVVSSVVYCPVILLDSSLCAEWTKDSDNYIKFMFMDRSDVILDYMQRNSVYKKIVSESIGELIQRSKKLLEQKFV
ncbi:uncharacterized protein LOC111643014 [Copidosoma floridanum]|uniref:uncharacterized protein LOC106644108 n=1 Tax=Copidosoma floridanum TaxID=29053 RepID=UPI0006C9B9AB|nr:uncharacterized protein LOC106644108 [Copidosoma floridanum]XP_023245751.1 uncharacterized protein LOC111643014 [Copidosoma floridanum]